MISYARALDLIAAAALVQKDAIESERRAEQLPLERAIGRELCEDVFSREAHPLFDNSAMDGFAVRSVDTERVGVHGAVFHVLGSIAAGNGKATLSAKEQTEKELPSCVEIMTGAPLPKGFDAVIRVEDVEILENEPGKGIPTKIRLMRSVNVGENVRRRGEDFQEGTLLCGKGTRVEMGHLLALGAAGSASLSVKGKLRAALLSTGDELVEVAEKDLSFGKIRNSSAVYLQVALKALDVEVIPLGIIGDRRDNESERLIGRLEQMITSGSVDVIISTGAVSMGRYDFIPEAIKRMGGEILFHKTAIRPGKPILFSTLGNGRIAWFGLPGNPVSTAVGLRFFVMPFLKGPEKPGHEVLIREVKKPKGLKSFLLGRRSKAGVEVIPAQASFKVAPLLHANCWVALPEDSLEVKAGELVEVFSF